MWLLLGRGGSVWSQDHLDHWNCANPRGLGCLATRQGYPEAERDVNFLRQFMTIARGTYRYMFGSWTGESPLGLNLSIFCCSSFFSVQKYGILGNLQSPFCINMNFYLLCTREPDSTVFPKPCVRPHVYQKFWWVQFRNWGFSKKFNTNSTNRPIHISNYLYIDNLDTFWYMIL